jgi:hypothetical protein
MYNYVGRNLQRLIILLKSDRAQKSTSFINGYKVTDVINNN